MFPRVLTRMTSHASRHSTLPSPISWARTAEWASCAPTRRMWSLGTSRLREKGCRKNQQTNHKMTCRHFRMSSAMSLGRTQALKALSPASSPSLRMPSIIRHHDMNHKPLHHSLMHPWNTSATRIARSVHRKAAKCESKRKTVTACTDDRNLMQKARPKRILADPAGFSRHNFRRSPNNLTLTILPSFIRIYTERQKKLPEGGSDLGDALERCLSTLGNFASF